MAPRTLNRLSARTVATLKTPGRHADGGGLYLHVDSPVEAEGGKEAAGAKRWVFVFQWQKKRKEMGLGPARLVDLKEAREAALTARKMVAAGRNPIEVRRMTGEGAPTFDMVADEVLATIEATDPNPKHLSQWKTSLKVYAKPIADKRPDAITTEDVLEVLKPIWGEIPEMASRTRGRIERVLDAAKAKGLRSGENPARWRGHLALLLPPRRKLTRGHHPALPYKDIPAFMAMLRAREALAARALELTILAATRTGETLGARWGELDLDGGVWTIPAERMKVKVEHRVPLSAAVVAMLRPMLAAQLEAWPKRNLSNGLVFPASDPTKPLSNMAMEMLLRRMDASEVTVHGFRSTFRDWAGEETEHPREVIEAALAHTVGSEVERAYRRGDALEKRRGLMQDWAGHCGSRTPSMPA